MLKTIFNDYMTTNLWKALLFYYVDVVTKFISSDYI